jgi:hypothetical protein
MPVAANHIDLVQGWNQAVKYRSKPEPQNQCVSYGGGGGGIGDSLVPRAKFTLEFTYYHLNTALTRTVWCDTDRIGLEKKTLACKEAGPVDEGEVSNCPVAASAMAISYDHPLTAST